MRTVLLLLLIILLTTCTKFGENIHVSGRVLNPATGIGIANVKIELQKKTTFEYATGFKAVETVYTDNNGEFEIRHLGGLKQYYIRCQYTQDYYPLGWFVNSEKQTSDFIKIKKGKTFYAEYQMLPYGYYKFSIINVNCLNEMDSLIVNKFHNIIYGYQDYNNPMFFIGCYNSIGVDYRKVPMGKLYYEGKLIRNGVTTPFYREIFIEENAYQEWIIEY